MFLSKIDRLSLHNNFNYITKDTLHFDNKKGENFYLLTIFRSRTCTWKKKTKIQKYTKL